jgi:hypothetical protein
MISKFVSFVMLFGNSPERVLFLSFRSLNADTCEITSKQSFESPLLDYLAVSYRSTSRKSVANLQD